MDIFEQATRKHLRFQTVGGLYNVEDIWSLRLPQLNTLAKALNKVLKEQAEEDFLDTSVTAEDTDARLRFDIVLHIIKVKQDYVQVQEDASKVKLREQALLNALEIVEGSTLASMSKDDLLSELKSLRG